MNYISKCEDWTLKEYPDNEDECKYKLSDYAIVEPYKDGYILFHTITWSFFFLTPEEYDNILSNDFFISKRIVLSDKIDEFPIAESVYVKRSTRNITAPYDSVSSYVILTTNECNANCPYCYEWLKKGRMTVETAEKFIDLVKEKNKKNKTVHISWFGGEPLKNMYIIDYIINRFKEEHIDYSSTMISNSLLLTKDVVDKAVNSWKLTFVQITLDGPEEIYNRVKNYDDFEGSAFKQVMENIKYIKENTKIKVSIRLNITPENIDYMYELVDYLMDTVIGGNVSFYFKMEYGVANNVELRKKDNFEERYDALVEKYSTNKERFLIKKKDLMYCMADGCSCLAITPEGNIHACEHCAETSKLGTLDTGIIDSEVINKIVTKGGVNVKFCKEVGCKLIPVCKKVNFCPPQPRCTTEDFYELENRDFKKKLKYTTDYYFEKLEEMKNKKGEG